MGAWGVKLYDNDVAEDIKNTYKEKLQEGKSNEEATDEIISDYEYMLEDVDDAPLFLSLIHISLPSYSVSVYFLPRSS